VFNYDYIEPLQTRSGDNPVYQMSVDLRYWINKELEKRLVKLKEKTEQSPCIYLTMRTFRKHPVFIIGTTQNTGIKILEAWYFHFITNPDAPRKNLYIALDRVVLKSLFADMMQPEKPAENFAKIPDMPTEDDSE
jgi:hypothetical protein